MQLSRRQVLRRRRGVVFTAAGALLAAGFYLPMTLLAPLGSVAASEQLDTVPAATAAAIDWPTQGASAIGAVGFDGLLGLSGSEKAVPMASISKIVTALVVLDKHPLDLGDAGPEIEFSATDVAIRESYLAVNGKTEPVTAGMTLTQRQVMDVMLLESANNYAESLATWAYGSVEEFVPIANAWLARNGMESTSITEPTGMSARNVSTAADLVTLGELALGNPVVEAIVGTPSEALPVVGDIENSNNLLGIDGIRGIKTGTLDEAGACLLFAADFTVGDTTETLVGAVLGGSDHRSLNLEVRELLADAVAGFHNVVLAEAGEDFGSYTTAWGQTSRLVAAESANVVVWSNAQVESSIEADELRLGARGDDVGVATFSVGDRTIRVPLELASPLDDPGPWWRLTNPSALF
jgi:D-alanyl-D-alanine carboxypeptidase (penicillin-binding protein 5/6)